MEWNAYWNSMEWNAHALECASGYVGVCGGKCWESALGNVERKIAIRAVIIETFISEETFAFFAFLHFFAFGWVPQSQPFPPKISCSFQW